MLNWLKATWKRGRRWRAVARDAKAVANSLGQFSTDGKTSGYTIYQKGKLEVWDNFQITKIFLWHEGNQRLVFHLSHHVGIFGSDYRRIEAFREGCWINDLKMLAAEAAEKDRRIAEEERRIAWVNLQPIDDCKRTGPELTEI